MQVLFTLLHILNVPQLRAYIRPRFAVQRLLCAFTSEIRTRARCADVQASH